MTRPGMPLRGFRRKLDDGAARRGASSRRRARGAVAVEAVIIASALTVVLGAGLFMHRAYAAKFRAIREARVAAWLPALRGCTKGPQLEEMTGPVTSVGDESSGGLSEDTFASWIAADGHDKPSSEVVQGANGFRSYTMTSKNQVTCNPISSDQEGVAAIADVIIQAVNKP